MTTKEDAEEEELKEEETHLEKQSSVFFLLLFPSQFLTSRFFVSRVLIVEQADAAPIAFSETTQEKKLVKSPSSGGGWRRMCVCLKLFVTDLFVNYFCCCGNSFHFF